LPKKELNLSLLEEDLFQDHNHQRDLLPPNLHPQADHHHLPDQIPHPNPQADPKAHPNLLLDPKADPHLQIDLRADPHLHLQHTPRDTSQILDLQRKKVSHLGNHSKEDLLHLIQDQRGWPIHTQEQHHHNRSMAEAEQCHHKHNNSKDYMYLT